MIKSLTPSGMSAPLARYAHGIVDSRSGIVMTSGQLAVDKTGRTPIGAEAQTQLILENIDLILSEAGTDKSRILKLNAYVTDRSQMTGYMAARDAWLSDVPHLAASTLMIVSGFTRPEFVVEIEVTASLG